MSLQEEFLKKKRVLFERAYGSLNEMQREAVFQADGPLLILAGAGSGKTTVLTNRIGYILRYGNAYHSDHVPDTLTPSMLEEMEIAKVLKGDPLMRYLDRFAVNPPKPYQMLAITFTNKAAGEIKDRLVKVLGNEQVAGEIWAGTFHSICMRILRQYGDRVGLRPNFTVYDTDDTVKAVVTAMKQLNIDEKQLPHKEVVKEMENAKNRLITPEEYSAKVGSDFRYQRIAKVYAAYQDQLEKNNAVDFNDIIMKTVRLLEENKEIRENYRKKFRYVSIDEYQDTNAAQFRLAYLLSREQPNLMVVGDDDQSIYRFRGADITNILDFDKRFSDVRVIRLEENYRSTQTILDAANGVIGHNESRHQKTLYTSRGKGSPIEMHLALDQNKEAQYIVDKITEGVASGERTYRDFAVLYRTNAQSQTMEKIFAKSGIPYRLLGGIRFNDRKEIRDVVAYLQLSVNHADNERLKRIINEPKRKIGPALLTAVEQIAYEQNTSMFEILRTADRYPVLSNGAVKLMAFASMIGDFSDLLETDITLEAFVNTVLDKSGYRAMLIAGGEEERDRVENVEEFVSGVIDYENRTEDATLVGFLEENALVADVDKYDETADACVLMTIHSAKGLEFPEVFLPGFEEGLFPGLQTILEGDAGIEEERRLCYVAITRAKDKLSIIHTKSRLLYGRSGYNPLSRFAAEIPAELVTETDGTLDSFGGGFGSYGMGKPKTYFSQSADTPDFSVRKSPKEKEAFGRSILDSGRRKNTLPKIEKFEAGARVSHPTFGLGTVLSAKPMGSDTLYEIDFDKVGVKRLMATYGKLSKAD